MPLTTFEFLDTPKDRVGNVIALSGKNPWLGDLARRHALAAWSLPEQVDCGPEGWEGEALAGSLFGGRVIIVEPASGLEKAMRSFKPPADWPHRLLLVCPLWRGKDWDGTDTVVDTDSVPLGQAKVWLKQQFSLANLDIDSDALDALTRLPTDTLGSEAEKVICYCLGRRLASRRDVELLTQEQNQSSAWKILDSLDKPEQCWAIFQDVFAQDQNETKQAMILWSALATQLRKLVRAVHLRKANLSAPEAIERAGIESWQAGSAARAIGILKKRLLVALDWLLEAEASLKGRGRHGSLSPRMACEILLGRLLYSQDSNNPSIRLHSTQQPQG